MQITEMIVTPIAISDPPLLNAAGLHAPYALRVIVEVISDDNIYGLGELPGGADVVADLEAIKPLVIGSDPFEMNALQQRLEQHFGGQASGNKAAMRTTIYSRRASRAFAGVEVACLDLVGKAIGQPVCNLLGGKVRDRVPFSAYLFYKYKGAGGPLGFEVDSNATGWAAARQEEALTPDGIVAQAQAMCREFGFKSIKLKGGVFEPQVEVDSMWALHKAFGPDVPLRLDPNAIWSVETSIKYGKLLEGALEYYEDPTRGQAGMAEVAKSVGLPLATNMCTVSFDDIPNAVRVGSEQIILSDHHFWGGLRASVELARICRTFGRGLSMHSNSHIGISLKAMAHLAAAVPNLTYACDTHYPWQSEEALAGGRLAFDDGSLVIGNAPGLGVELDRAALAVLHENYLKCGLTKRDDEIEMQKVQPGWTFSETRW
jgi:glucarate dehydratase